MSSYLLHNKLTAKEKEGTKLATLLIEASELVINAKGCHSYIVSMNDEAPEDIWVTEIWESKEDHAASLQLPKVKELISKALPILAGPPTQGQELTVLGGL